MPIGGRLKVELHPELFESAIERHGQYLRWYSSIPCFCADELARPDPNCDKCLGRGYIYYPARRRRRMELVFSYGGYTLTTKYDIKVIRRIYSPSSPDVDVSYDSFQGKIITALVKFRKGAYFYVDYDEDLEVSFTGAAVWLGNGIIRASIDKIVTNQGSFVGEIAEVTSLTNVTRSETMNVLAFWEDMILTDSYAEEADELEIVCKYTKPIQFLVNQITQKQREQSFAIFQDADASCSFPGYITAGRGDIITLLKAEQKDSVVGNFMGDDTYVLPFFHVSSLIRIEDNIGEITGAQIIRNNEILFTDRTPENRFSISFLYHPSFVMMGELPSLRYGENKVLPKKVALKRYEMYGRQERRPKAAGYEMEDVY